MRIKVNTNIFINSKIFYKYKKKKNYLLNYTHK